jgi:uncharacterized membrane protein YuzA (DUF378 family)
MNLNIKQPKKIEHVTLQQGAYPTLVYMYIGLCGSQTLIVIFKRPCKKNIINA